MYGNTFHNEGRDETLPGRPPKMPPGRLSEFELGRPFHDVPLQVAREGARERHAGLRRDEAAQREPTELFGCLLAGSSTLGDALLRATRFIQLVAPNVELSLHVEGNRAVLLTKALANDPSDQESATLLLLVTGAMARELTGRHLVPLEVRLTHAPPPEPAHYEQLFETASIYFARPHNGYVFSSSLLSLAIRTADIELCERLEREADALLARRPKGRELSRSVQEAISQELYGGNPTAEHVADKLGMHRKTLGRRLRAEGTSYQKLLDELRHRLADEYLHESRLSLGDIALLLGYSGPGAFNKAFRRWTGSAPRHHR